MNSETKVFIYYAPTSIFNKNIDNKKGKESLTAIIQEYDQKQKYLKFIFDKNSPFATNNESSETEEKDEIEDIKKLKTIKTLTVGTNEYSGITESAMQNFVAILNSFVIEEIHLQNPPLIVSTTIKENFSNIEEYLHEYPKINEKQIKEMFKEYPNFIVGQNEAFEKTLAKIYFAIETKREKPLVILFYGPSGVGKTESAKFLSTKFGGELFRKQFSMFQTNEFNDYLFGGIHNKNSFAKDLLNRESNVILLDEFDKVNPHFYSAFYQIFDEGVFEDKNYQIDLKNTIIICTTNFLNEEDVKKRLSDPIFYRFDSFVKFDKLDRNSIEWIIDHKYEKCLKTMSASNKKYLNEHLIKTNNEPNGIGIKELLYKNANKISNARLLDNLLNDLISDALFLKIKK